MLVIYYSESQSYQKMQKLDPRVWLINEVIVDGLQYFAFQLIKNQQALIFANYTFDNYNVNKEHDSVRQLINAYYTDSDR